MAARIGASGPAAAATARADVVLRAVGLTKRFGRVVALDGLDLEVGAGEVHAFLGPNGAGKTTTIRILLGLLKADAGEVTLFGGDPWRDAVELHRRLAYVPGDLTLWPSLTGGEIIDLLGRLRGGIDAQRRRALTEELPDQPEPYILPGGAPGARTLNPRIKEDRWDAKSVLPARMPHADAQKARIAQGYGPGARSHVAAFQLEGGGGEQERRSGGGGGEGGQVVVEG